MAFNINAQIILDGPKNITAVKSRIKKQLTGLSVPIKLEIPKNLSGNIKSVSKDFAALDTTLSRLNATASTTNSTLKALNATAAKAGAASTKAATNAKSQSASLKNVSKQAQAAAGAMEDFGTQTRKSLKSLAAFSLGTTVVFGFIRAVQQGVTEAIKFERELVKITQVTGRAGQSLSSLRSTIDQLSVSLGINANELVDVARTFAQTGQSINEIQNSLRAVARASLAPTFDGMTSSAEGLIAALNQFDIEAGRSEAILGSLNAVSKKFAVEASDLISVIRRAGGVFAASSIQLGAPEERLRELIGIFTAVRSTTRESADTIATGLRTIFSRIQRPKTIEFLQGLGVELRATAADAKALGTTEGEFVGIFEAIRRVGLGIKSLDTIQLAQVVEELGGIRQVGKLIPALRNFEKAEQARAVALSGTKSLTQDVALATETLAVRFGQVQARFEKFIRTISESRTFQTLAEGVLTLSNSLLFLAETLTPLLPLFTAFAAVKLTKAAVNFGQGFIGGSAGGGGVRGAGAAIGGVVSGQGGASTKALESAVRKLTNDILANTNTVKNNTAAVGTNTTSINNLVRELPALITAIRSIPASAGGFAGAAGSRRRPIRRARGGFVPGTGNGDTVPALLTPGEFVIKKSSAQSLGASTLQAMNNNKMALGGIATNPGAIGAFFLNPPSGSDPVNTINTKVPITNPSVLSRLGKGPRDEQLLRAGVLSNTTKRNQESLLGTKLRGGALSASSFLKTTGAPKGAALQETLSDSRVQQNIDRFAKSPKARVNPEAIKLTGPVSSFFTANSDVKKSAAISKKVAGATKAGMEEAIQVAVNGTQSVLQGIDPIDADEQKLFKRSLSSLFSKGGGAIETVEGFIFEGLIAGLTGSKIAGGGASFDFPAFSGASKGRLKELFGDNDINRLVKADAKRSFSQGIIGSNKSGSIPSKIATDVNAGRLDGITLAAKGGTMTGTDTVPALLTPGEFVINRSSAQSIGYNNLKSMNATGVSKFAKGGAVGGIQKFQGGGSVANNAINLVFGAQALASIDFSTPSENLVSNLLNLGITVALLSEPLKQLGGLLGKFTPALGNATKGLEGLGRRLPSLRGTSARVGLGASSAQTGPIKDLVSLLRGGRKGFAQDQARTAFQSVGGQRSAARLIGPAADAAVKKQGNALAKEAFKAANGKAFGKAVGLSVGRTLLANKGNLVAIGVSIGAAAGANFAEKAFVGTRDAFEGIEETGFSRGRGAGAAAGIQAGGGALAGAAAGGSLGVLLGPVGAAVGAAVGAVVGGLTSFASTVKDQAIFEEFEKVSLAATGFANNLRRLAESGLESSQSLQNVADSGNNLLAAFNSNVQNVSRLRASSVGTIGGALEQAGGFVESFKQNLIGLTALTGTSSSRELARGAVSGGLGSGSTDRLGITFGSTGIGRLAGFGGRADAAQEIAGRTAQSQVVSQSLSLIDDDALAQAQEQSDLLSQNIINSIPVDQLEALSNIDSGAGLEALTDGLRTAGDDTALFTSKVNALAALQKTVATKNLKDFTTNLDALQDTLGEDRIEFSNLIDTGKTAALSFQQGLTSGLSTEEAGKQAKEEFLKGLQSQAAATGEDISNELLSFDQLGRDFQDLDRGGVLAADKIGRLAEKTGLSVSEIQSVFGQLDAQLNNTNDGFIQQLAAQRAIEEAARAAAEGVDALGSALDQLGSKFANIVNDISVSTANFAQVAGISLGGEGSVTTAARGNVFAGGGAGRSLQELQAGISRTGANVGLGAGQTQGFAEAINLQNELPNAIKKTFLAIEKGEVNPDEVADILKDNLGAGFDNLPDVVKDQFSANIDSLIAETGLNRQENLGATGVKTLQDAIRQGNLDGILSETGNKIADTFDKLNEAQNVYISALQKSAQVQVDLDKARTGVRQQNVGLRQRFRFGAANLGGAGDRLESAGATLGPSEIFDGTTVGGSLDRGSLRQDRQFLQSALQENLAQQEAGGGDQEALLNENAKLTAALNRNKAATEQLSTDTRDLEAIQKQIADIEKLKLGAEQRGDLFLQQLSGAGSQKEADQLTREFFAPLEAAGRAQRGETLTHQQASLLRRDLRDPAGQARADIRGNLEGQGLSGQALEDAVQERIDNLFNATQRGVVGLGGRQLQNVGVGGARSAQLSQRQFGTDRFAGQTEDLEIQGRGAVTERNLQRDADFNQTQKLINDQQAAYRVELEKTNEKIRELSTNFGVLTNTTAGGPPSTQTEAERQAAASETRGLGVISTPVNAPAQRRTAPTTTATGETVADTTIIQKFSTSTQLLTDQFKLFGGHVDRFTEALKGGLNVNLEGGQQSVEVVLNGGGLIDILNQQTLDKIADAVSIKLKGGGNGPRPDGSTADPSLQNQ